MAAGAKAPADLTCKRDSNGKLGERHEEIGNGSDVVDLLVAMLSAGRRVPIPWVGKSLGTFRRSTGRVWRSRSSRSRIRAAQATAAERDDRRLRRDERRQRRRCDRQRRISTANNSCIIINNSDGAIVNSDQDSHGDQTSSSNANSTYEYIELDISGAEHRRCRGHILNGNQQGGL